MGGDEVSSILDADGAWWTPQEIRDHVRRSGVKVSAVVIGEAIAAAHASGRIDRQVNLRAPASRRALSRYEYATADKSLRVPS